MVELGISLIKTTTSSILVLLLKVVLVSKVATFLVVMPVHMSAIVAIVAVVTLIVV